MTSGAVTQLSFSPVSLVLKLHIPVFSFLVFSYCAIESSMPTDLSETGQWSSAFLNTAIVVEEFSIYEFLG